jgi:hypothetical protein
VKILHILKQAPDASTRKIIEIQAAGYEVKIIELYQGTVDYDSLLADVFSYEKVFCW